MNSKKMDTHERQESLKKELIDLYLRDDLTDTEKMRIAKSELERKYGYVSLKLIIEAANIADKTVRL